tara:strand:- start:6055 stop:7101 length:1047 start_codon:yes stop_codon:yes gene_type:complete
MMVDALFDESALEIGLKAFAEYCGAPIGHLMVADGQRTLLRSCFSQAMDEDLAASEANYQQINPRVLAIPKMQQGKATRDKDFISRKSIELDTTYQELILPMGLGHFCGVPIVHNSEMTAGIAIHRPIREEPFRDSEAYRHEQAAAACASVFQLATKIDNRLASDSVNLFGDHTPTASLDRRGHVLGYNEAFESLLIQNHIQVGMDRTLCFGSGKSRRSLKEALNHRNGTVGGRFVAPGVRRTNLWVCTVVPFPFAGLRGASAATALIYFKRIEVASFVEVRLLREAFGLTVAESAVARLLCEGHSLEKISEIRGVSLSTTRTLLKRIMLKAECNRQSELVLKITAMM